jgi:hypothetical protein
MNEPQPPKNLNSILPFCPYCGNIVYPLSLDECVIKCEVSCHTIGWNRQLWIPKIVEHCEKYGFNKSQYEKYLKECEIKTKEIIES